jgi:hypothetical protein
VSPSGQQRPNACGMHVQKECECVGNYSKFFCNHWISREALCKYILSEAEEQRFHFACPKCKSDPCERCGLHNAAALGGTRRCFIPPLQVRSILAAEELDKCGSPSSTIAMCSALLCRTTCIIWQP